MTRGLVTVTVAFYSTGDRSVIREEGTGRRLMESSDAFRAIARQSASSPQHAFGVRDFHEAAQRIQQLSRGHDVVRVVFVGHATGGEGAFMFSGHNDHRDSSGPVGYNETGNQGSVLRASDITNFLSESGLAGRQGMEFDFRTCFGADQHARGQYIRQVSDAVARSGGSTSIVRGNTAIFRPVVHREGRRTWVEGPPSNVTITRTNGQVREAGSTLQRELDNLMRKPSSSDLHENEPDAEEGKVADGKVADDDEPVLSKQPDAEEGKVADGKVTDDDGQLVETTSDFGLEG